MFLSKAPDSGSGAPLWRAQGLLARELLQVGPDVVGSGGPCRRAP